MPRSLLDDALVQLPQRSYALQHPGLRLWRNAMLDQVRQPGADGAEHHILVAHLAHLAHLAHGAGLAGHADVVNRGPPDLIEAGVRHRIDSQICEQATSMPTMRRCLFATEQCGPPRLRGG
jgi:hypothetical protein